MKKTKKCVAVVLLIALLFSMNIASVFATDSIAESNPKVYAEGTNTLNLQGNFIANGSDGAIWVKDGAQLTINGTDETQVHGTLGVDKYSMAVWAKADGTKVVINGGHYTNETDGSDRGTDLIYASDGAQIEINGGKFEAAKTEWTLNCKDNTTSKIIVKGGTFYKFDPSNTSVGEGEIVIPDGYGVVKNGDWYTVVETVFDKGTNTLNLEGELTANGSNGAIWVKDGAQLIINGTNETQVHGTLGVDKYSMAVWAKADGTKVVINGGYYTNETDGSVRGTDLIYASDGAQIEINGGKFEAAKTEWTLNCKDNTTSKITVKGGTFYNFDPSNTNVGEGEIVVPDGYRVVKNGEWYTVYKENTIIVEEVEGGNVSVMPAKAIAGEIVSLTVKANDGYELDNITVIDSNGDTVKITDNEFVMPDSAVTVKAEFTKIIPPMDYVISGNETENSNIGVVETEKTVETLDTSLKANTELNKKVEEERQNGNQVTVEITMEELDEESVKVEEKQKILQNIGKNQTVHQYFDISILVRTSEKELGKLTELREEMTFSMEIPKELIQEGRTFYIINLHNGEVKRIDAILNGTKLEFATAHFSTFALAYEDELPTDDSITDDDDVIEDDNITENDGMQEVPGGDIQEPTEEPTDEPKEETKEEVNVPNTGDNIVLYLILVIAALTGIVILRKVNSKKNDN